MKFKLILLLVDKTGKLVDDPIVISRELVAIHVTWDVQSQLLTFQCSIVMLY